MATAFEQIENEDEMRQDRQIADADARDDARIDEDFEAVFGSPSWTPEITNAVEGAERLAREIDQRLDRAVVATKKTMAELALHDAKWLPLYNARKAAEAHEATLRDLALRAHNYITTIKPGGP